MSQLLGEKIIVGGSSVFDQEFDTLTNPQDFDTKVDVRIDTKSNLDLVVVVETVNDLDKRLVLKTFRKKLIFSGEVFSAEYIEKQHTNYLKIRLFDNTFIDLHVCGPNESLDIVEVPKQIEQLMDKMGYLQQFKIVLKELRYRFKMLGIYGQSFGYLNGTTMCLMLEYLMQHQGMKLADARLWKKSLNSFAHCFQHIPTHFSPTTHRT